MPCPPRGYCPGGYCPGGYCPGGYCPGGYCPGGYCPPYCAAAVPSPSTSTKISATPLHQPARQIRCAKFRYTISLTSDASRFPPVTPVFPWDRPPGLTFRPRYTVLGVSAVRAQENSPWQAMGTGRDDPAPVRGVRAIPFSPTPSAMVS